MGAGTSERRGIEVLDFGEAMRLAATQPVGRLGYIDRGEPVVVPVNFAIDGLSIVIRLGDGAALDSINRDRPVAFEVDGIEPATRSGWSVLVRGHGVLVEGDERIAKAEATGVRPWADDLDRPVYVRIIPSEITGRRIPPHDRVSFALEDDT